MWLFSAVAVGGGLLVLLMTGGASVARAQTPISETGPYCINDYQPGSVCTANDVRIVDVKAANVITPCSGPGSVATIQFIIDIRALASGASSNRYDIGIFIDQDGIRDGAELSGKTTANPDGVARTLGCYHTYLSGPLTATPGYALVPNDRSLGTGGVVNTTDGIDDLYDGPWWDGSTDSPPEPPDNCGDIQTGTQLFKTLDTLDFTCNDNNEDGTVELSVCSSWDNQTGGFCSNVKAAFPNMKSKCSCLAIELPFTPCGDDVAAAPSNLSIAVNPAAIGVDLAWQAGPGNVSFQVWRDVTPYFTPDPASETPLAAPVTPAYTDAGVLGNPALHAFYVVTGVDVCGHVSAPVGRVGKFEFELAPRG